MTLSVAETFGPTVQGEGPSAGRRCAFIRLGLCNLDCSWCDTPYTWDWTGKNGRAYDRKTELHLMEVSEVLAWAASVDVRTFVISGGEPLVQRKGLLELLPGLAPFGRIEVETNGTIDPGELVAWVDQWNVSPKLAHSGVDRKKAWKPGVLSTLAAQGAAFKFVVQTVDDFDEIATLQRLTGIDNSHVWVMPEGRSTLVLNMRLRELADEAIVRGYNITNRLHVVLWGDERGR